MQGSSEGFSSRRCRLRTRDVRWRGVKQRLNNTEPPRIKEQSVSQVVQSNDGNSEVRHCTAPLSQVSHPSPLCTHGLHCPWRSRSRVIIIDGDVLFPPPRLACLLPATNEDDKDAVVEQRATGRRFRRTRGRRRRRRNNLIEALLFI